MYLWVPVQGELAWHFKYRVLGREKRLSLGMLRDVSLSLARKKRDELRRQIAEGLDPGQVRKQARLAASHTFKHVREDWERVHGSKQAAATQERRASQIPYLVRLDNRPVAGITAQDVLECLRPIEAAGKHTTAHQVLRLAGQLLS